MKNNTQNMLIAQDTLPGGGFHGGEQHDTLPGDGFHADQKALIEVKLF